MGSQIGELTLLAHILSRQWKKVCTDGFGSVQMEVINAYTPTLCPLAISWTETKRISRRQSRKMKMRSQLKSKSRKSVPSFQLKV
jgi:hypothetical protein